jgi:hypothetical protein
LKNTKEQPYGILLLGGPRHNETLLNVSGSTAVPGYVQKEEWDTRGYVVFRYEEKAA